MHDILSKNEDDPSLLIPIRRVECFTLPDEVYRSTEVHTIGDLHGNSEILERNLHSLGVMDTLGKWIGGNKRLVLLGDIIGDRGTTGLVCMRTIFRLRNEAREAGGDITVLAGNHEDIAISFLTDRPIAGTSPDKSNLHAFKNAWLNMQGFGIIEFARDYFIKNIDI